MSRAINVDATQAEVAKACLKNNAGISASETLASGGTRVVFDNADAARQMTAVFGRKVITGDVRRTPLRTWAR